MYCDDDDEIAAKAIAIMAVLFLLLAAVLTYADKIEEILK